MEDVVIAGTFGVAGVLASGSIQTYLAVRADRRKTKGARREVLVELTELTPALLITETGDEEFASALQATILPEPRAFEKHASLLAQGLSDGQWAAVYLAYNQYEMVRRGLQSSDRTAAAFARETLVASAIDACGEAVAALTSRGQRADDARGLQELRDRAKRIGETGRSNRL